MYSKFIGWTLLVLGLAILYLVALVLVAMHSVPLAVAIFIIGIVTPYIVTKAKYYQALVQAAMAAVTMQDMIDEAFDKEGE